MGSSLTESASMRLGAAGRGGVGLQGFILARGNGLASGRGFWTSSLPTVATSSRRGADLR